MSEKVAVIYYSATGNTEAMAEAVSIGAKSVVEEVLLARVADVDRERIGKE